MITDMQKRPLVSNEAAGWQHIAVSEPHGSNEK